MCLLLMGENDSISGIYSNYTEKRRFTLFGACCQLLKCSSALVSICVPNPRGLTEIVMKLKNEKECLRGIKE